MVRLTEYRKFCISLPEVMELPHFEKTSFRIRGKIFSTLDDKREIAMVKLSLIDQSVFCAAQAGIIYPVPGGWGKKGATYIDLKKARLSIVKDAVLRAYELMTTGKT